MHYGIMLLAIGVFATDVLAVDLSGTWRIKLDPKNEGVAQQWFSGPLKSDATIALPGTTSTAGLGNKTEGADKHQLTLLWKYMGPAWYQREIEIPPSWIGRRVNLHLERVLGRSTIWVDGKWLNADRQYDPRHLYSVSAGRRVESADDFCEYGAKMNWQTPHTDWDYSEYYTRSGLANIPEFVHELGQPATHPDWRELTKYTGVLKPRNLEAFLEAAKAAGVESQSAQFQKASGRINVLNYKFDVEACLRTPQCAGYSLLDMHDYPGQGEALVGWLDAFFDEKGFLSAKEYSQYGGATVPLARLPKFVFTDGETLEVKVELAHYGAGELKIRFHDWKTLAPA